MNNYIYTNSNLLLNKILKIISLSSKNKNKNKNNICNHCSKTFDLKYKYKNLQVSEHLLIKEIDIHLLEKHFKININLYKKILLYEVPDYFINWTSLDTNGLNILDGLYNIGSNKIYIEKNKNIFNSKKNRFSEHAGFIFFKKNKIDKITVLNNSRVESSDPTIYLPNNNQEALKVDYLFHTHPKTPYIGSRIKVGIIYEFPSINDIIHYIEHHNNGRLLGSIIITPEGIYIIHKNIFDREIIKLDYDIMYDKLDEIYSKCFSESYNEYKKLDYKNMLINNEIKLSEEKFYSFVSTNFYYIQEINKVLLSYDIHIDYYPRIKINSSLDDSFKWIFPDIYIPIIN